MSFTDILTLLYLLKYDSILLDNLVVFLYSTSVEWKSSLFISFTYIFKTF